MKDYYYILGVKSNASSEIIRDAYRKLSKRFHPDINNGDKFLEERFKEINEAYETLSDDGKRRIYHEKLLRFNSKSGGNTNNDFENKKREEEFAAKKRAFETEKIRIEKEKRDLEAERAQFEFSKRGQNTNKNQNKTDNISNTNDAKYTSQYPKKIKDNDSNELKSILKFVEFLIPVIIFVGAFVYLKNEGYLDKKIEEENQNNFAILPDMVFIEGGTFQMGSDDYEVDEKPVHNVKLSSFKLAKFEVTQMLWEAVMKYNPSHFKADRLPVETVSWDAVQEFLVKINSMTGNNYRLPTEAEWEYAARGGNKSNLSKFSGSNNLNDIAWYDGNSEDKTHIVGSLKPNELGLFDMSGNVWEWCSDRYGDSYYKNSLLVNPIGMKFGSNHIFRGGSYTCSSNICHVSHRFKGPVNAISYGLGFRLAMSVN